MNFGEVMALKKSFEENGLIGSRSIETGASIFSTAVGQWVIVRSYSEGINFGKVEAADETGIVLSDARRLWKPVTENGIEAWYEGVSVHGLAAEARISGTAAKKVIVEDYSITFCSDAAIEQIKNHPANLTNI